MLLNLIYGFGVVLLHPAFLTATATNFAVTGESLCEPFGSDIADALLSLDVNGFNGLNFGCGTYKQGLRVYSHQGTAGAGAILLGMGQTHLIFAASDAAPALAPALAWCVCHC